MFRFLLALLTVVCATVSLAGTGLSDYFPRSGETPDWTPVDTLLVFVGDDLYQMIDGGAEIYREYGFVRAGTQEFVDEDGHSVTIELYEMKGSVAAYGMFSFKARGEGQEIPMGNGGRQTDYYLNFWKGRYLATLTGLDTSSVTRGAVEALARALEKKIAENGELPILCRKPKPVIDGRRPTLTYIRGPIALNNFYRFSPSDIFQTEEGCVLDYGDFKAFVFDYYADPTARSRFASIQEAFQKDSSFTFDDKRPDQGFDRFLMTDRKARGIICTYSGRYIIVTVGRNPDEADKVERELEMPLMRYWN
ncbi:MAG: hypothetical protein PHR28_00860 [candidate division Zixibacteria bacterium]|nr:hypothetical protein [candidate division Zixibacteria bacterium]